MFYIIENIRRVRKAKDIHISENKANLVNKQKDVKSNFKALELQEANWPSKNNRIFFQK